YCQPHHSSANRPVRSNAHCCSHHLRLFSRPSLAKQILTPIIALQRRVPTMCRLGGLSRSQSAQRFIDSSDSSAQNIPSSLVLHPRTCLLRQICAKTIVVHRTAEGVGQRSSVVLPMKKTCGSVRHDFGHRRHIGRSEEHTSELQSRFDLVCRLLLGSRND